MLYQTLSVLHYTVLCTSTVSAISGLSNFQELVSKVFPSDNELEFIPLPHFNNIGINGNETAILQVRDLFVSHYPIKKGHITFALDHKITGEIPKDSSMDIVSYVNDDLLFNGTVPICDYLTFAKLECPLKEHQSFQITKHVLRVPSEAGDGRLSFIAKAYTPSNELIVHLAGIIDLINDGTEALEEDEAPFQHDEL